LSDIDGLLCLEKIAKEELDHALHCQYFFWKERAKMLWFKDGDRNTSFFHAMVKRRNNYSEIHRLRINNKVIEDPKLIKDHILDYYKKIMLSLFLMFQTQEIWRILLVVIFLSYFPMMLIKCPDFLKIKTVVFNLHGNSAPGPDGFGGVFYHSCWDIIGTGVCNVVQQFF